MKIGIDVRNVGKNRTGDEAVFFNLVKNLALIDSQNTYLLLTDIMDEALLENIKKDLVIFDKPNFQIISLKSPNRFVWNLWTLPNYIRKNPLDAYHTQYIVPFFVPKKTKIITIIHDISFNFFPQFIKFSDLLFLKTLLPISLKRADKIIGVSQFTRDEISRYYGISPQKIDFIYNAAGDNFRERNFSEEELLSVRKKYNLPEKFFLYIGTHQPRKNLSLLIEGFAKIKDRLSGVKLVLAGNKNARNFDRQIEETIKKLHIQEEVIFTGYIKEEDKPALFKLAHVFVFPSLYEGFGIPLLEAMSQKTPVLASDIPSFREIAGDGALFFNSQDLDDFSEKLYNVFVSANTRENLINAGCKRAGFFSWEKTAQKTLAMYNQIKKH